MPDIAGGITGTGNMYAGVSGGSNPAAVPTGGAFLGVQAPPAPSGLVTGGYPQGTAVSGSTSLTPAIQQIWSKEILFQAMPILRFEQFAVKKTELGVTPGLTVAFLKYNNLDVDSVNGAALTEGIRMTTSALSAFQYKIVVGEQGKAIAVSELLLHASFDDVMASGARLLGRHMAQSMDYQARNVLLSAAGNVAFGYRQAAPFQGSSTNIYDPGIAATAIANVNDQTGGAGAAGAYYMTPHTIKDGVEQLSSLNIPRLGDTYVAFVHPHQSRRLRDTPEWIEVTKYAAPGNFMLGEIGRLNDVVFIETTQIRKNLSVTGPGTNLSYYDGIMIGDNAFGHAVSLPVELRDGGVLDFGREHALAWYAIWGFGAITPQSVVLLETN
jgi:N4-gp56 family major capsid protein